MPSKVVLLLCLMITISAAVPAKTWALSGWGQGNGANPWIPPWVTSAPWYPQWTPCTTIGSDCLDCSTKIVCTKIGGIIRPCSDPSLPHCNLGECSATPSADCATTDNPADSE